MQQALDGPKHVKSFRNKYLALCTASVLFFLTIPVFAQNTYDSTVNRQPSRIYGMDWFGNNKVRSSFVLPNDTPHMALADAGAIAYIGGFLYAWGGTHWFQIQGSSYDIQDSTSRLLSGQLLYDSNLTWHNTPNITYKILGRIYSAPRTVVNLSPGGANPRYDVVVATTSGTIDTLKGVAGPNPTIPVVDPATQFPLLIVNIGALATVPTDVSNQVIYAENGTNPSIQEWPGATAIPGGLFNYTETPHQGALSIYIPGSFAENSFIEHEWPYDLNKNDFSFFKFWNRLQGTNRNNVWFSISFYKDDLLVTSPAVTVTNNTYGHSATLLDEWQESGIGMEQFNFFSTPIFNKVRISFSNTSGQPFQLDDIFLQKGGGSFPPAISDTVIFDTCFRVVRKEVSGAAHDSVYLNTWCMGSGSSGITQQQLNDTAQAIRNDFPVPGGVDNDVDSLGGVPAAGYLKVTDTTGKWVGAIRRSGAFYQYYKNGSWVNYDTARTVIAKSPVKMYLPIFPDVNDSIGMPIVSSVDTGAVTPAMKANWDAASIDTAYKSIGSGIPGTAIGNANTAKGLWLRALTPATASVYQNSPFLYWSANSWKSGAPANSWPLVWRTGVVGGISSTTANGIFYTQYSVDSGNTWVTAQTATPNGYSFISNLTAPSFTASDGLFLTTGRFNSAGILIGANASPNPLAKIETRTSPDYGLLVRTNTTRKNQLTGSVYKATITSPGSGYTNGSFSNITVTSTTGIGTGQTADFVVAGGQVTSISPRINTGTNFRAGDLFTTSGLAGGTGVAFRVDRLWGDTAIGLIITDTTIRATQTWNGVAWQGDMETISASSAALRQGVDYVFTGTTSTFTLPAVSATMIGRSNRIIIINRGSGTITLNSNAGSTIYTTSAVGTINIAAGAKCEIFPDATYFNILYNN